MSSQPTVLFFGTEAASELLGRCHRKVVEAEDVMSSTPETHPETKEFDLVVFDVASFSGPYAVASDAAAVKQREAEEAAIRKLSSNGPVLPPSPTTVTSGVLLPEGPQESPFDPPWCFEPESKDARARRNEETAGLCPWMRTVLRMCDADDGRRMVVLCSPQHEHRDLAGRLARITHTMNDDWVDWVAIGDDAEFYDWGPEIGWVSSVAGRSCDDSHWPQSLLGPSAPLYGARAPVWRWDDPYDVALLDMVRQAGEPSSMSAIRAVSAARAGLGTLAGTLRVFQKNHTQSQILARTKDEWPCAFVRLLPNGLGAVYFLPNIIEKAELVRQFPKRVRSRAPRLDPGEEFDRLRVRNARPSKAKVEARLQAMGKTNPLVGDSDAMVKVYPGIEAALNHPERNVLLLGESGTGKEIVVNLLRDLRGCEVIPYNLQGESHDLAKSHLFGYKRGSHSTADADTPGLLAAAKDGILHLDGLEDTDPALQALLIRALDPNTRDYIPSGGVKREAVECQIVWSCNLPVNDLRRANKLRHDLLSRFGVTISLPPLRDRMEDFPALVKHFVNKHAPGRVPDSEIDVMVKQLQVQEWVHEEHRNVRELEVQVQGLCDGFQPGLAQTLRDLLPAGEKREFSKRSKMVSVEHIIECVADAKSQAEVCGSLGFTSTESLLNSLARVARERKPFKRLVGGITDVIRNLPEKSFPSA